MSTYNVPDIFKSDDTVYHYCSLTTAVEFILYDRKLRLSRRRNSIDPIENMVPFTSVSMYTNSDEIIPLQDRGSDIESVRNSFLMMIENAKQLCLCMNDSEKKSEHSRYLQDEYYGFLKPRMWDQYADKYKGVCLAFSLKKLRDQAGSLPNDLVKYMSYNHLEQHYYSFDEYLICKIGVDEYVSKLSDYIKTRMFKKHKDYSGENEYRFLSFSGSEYDYIDIEGCLTGIIISNNSSEFMKKALNEYAEKYNVELLNINWDSSGISIITKKENDKLISSIREFNE